MTGLAGLHVYTYDDVYQLINAAYPNMPIEQFTYDPDPVGNRQTSEGQAPSLRNTEYTYDFENRLIQLSYPGMLAQYKYDPFGRRIEKNVNGAITRYLYDGPNIVTEYDGAWNVQAQYTHTLEVDDPLTVTQGANTYYYHKDGLGSVVNLTDSAGNVVKSYTYKSFAEIYSESGSLSQPFTFTGREYDTESGLYYYRARYYDPRAGRFLTKDTIGFAGGDVNLYRMVQNDPVNWVDLEGLTQKGKQNIEVNHLGKTLTKKTPLKQIEDAIKDAVQSGMSPKHIGKLRALRKVVSRGGTMGFITPYIIDATTADIDRLKRARECGRTYEDQLCKDLEEAGNPDWVLTPIGVFANPCKSPFGIKEMY